MLFQEKAEKELLEYHLRREGPILEGDERFRENFGERKIESSACSTIKHKLGCKKYKTPRYFS